MLKNKLRTRGFTLIELIIVIAIIGILSGIILATLQNARVKARNVAKNALVREYIKAAELYYSHNGVYPYSNVEDFQVYCLGTGNVGGGCFELGTIISPGEIGGEDTDLNARFNTYLAGPPPSNTPAPGVGSQYYFGRGLSYSCTLDYSYNCTDFSIGWLIEGPNQSCGPANSRDPISSLFGGNTYCAYSSHL